MLSLSSARTLATECLKATQSKYKAAYNRKMRPGHFQLGDWVLVHFPQREWSKKKTLDHGMGPTVLYN